MDMFFSIGRTAFLGLAIGKVSYGNCTTQRAEGIGKGKGKAALTSGYLYSWLFHIFLLPPLIPQQHLCSNINNSPEHILNRPAIILAMERFQDLFHGLEGQSPLPNLPCAGHDWLLEERQAVGVALLALAELRLVEGLD
jgi:hypothetical protein